MKKIDNVQSLALLIRTYRKKQDLTQRQLAGLCNVGVRFIIDLEAGKESAHIGKVLHVVKMLGIQLETHD